MTLNQLRKHISNLQSNKLFEFVVISIIILSALLIGVKTYDVNSTVSHFLSITDVAITVFFALEISLRYFSYENKKDFFKHAWNIFDTIIVTISLIPIDESEFAFLARLIRVFRVLRLISFIPELRVLVGALIKALPSMGYVLLLMFILFYMYAAVGSFMFESINPTLWGDIAIAMLTLFRVVTFEDWTDVMYETMEVYPLSWIFYLSFIFFNAFVFLNMMIGIVISKMQEEHDEMKNLEQLENEHTTQELLNQINQRLLNIEEKIK